MNLVLLFSSILFTLFGIYTCAVLPSPSSVQGKPNVSTSNVGQEQVVGSSSSDVSEKKLTENLDDHAGDHDQKQSTKARKGVVLPVDDSGKVAEEVHTNHNISTDRASTTITKDSESIASKTSETSSMAKGKDKTNSNTSTSNTSDKYSPSESKSTKTDTSNTNTSTSIITEKSQNVSLTSDTSKTKSNSSKSSSSKSSSSKSVSTESTSSKSSFNKKPLVTYSVEDDPTLLNVPRIRQVISPLTPLDVKAEGDSAYLQPSNDFVLDRMQVKREMYIFPLVVLIFLVPMVLGVGIIIVRRVRDYWSTRHYRRMDFLVDGMYNT